jgi:hypothetical protein
VRILKGKNAGSGYELRQFANDWMTASGNGIDNIVVSPGNVQVDGDEYRRLSESYARWQSDPSTERVGLFWQLWRLNRDGTLSRRERGEQRNDLSPASRLGTARRPASVPDPGREQHHAPARPRRS